MRTPFKNGDIVQHFKREWIEDKLNDARYLYKYLGEARYSEDKSQKFVMYMALYDDPENDIKLFDCFVRPYDMFYSEVDKVKYPNASQKYRFEMYSEEPSKSKAADEEMSEEMKKRYETFLEHNPDLKKTKGDIYMESLIEAICEGEDEYAREHIEELVKAIHNE